MGIGFSKLGVLGVPAVGFKVFAPQGETPFPPDWIAVPWVGASGKFVSQPLSSFLLSLIRKSCLVLRFCQRKLLHMWLQIQHVLGKR